MQAFVISRPSPRQVWQVARLHSLVLTDSFLSKFGPQVLFLIYFFLLLLPGTLLLLLENKKRVVGFALAFTKFSLPQLLHPRISGPELQFIAVDPDYQRRGWGKRIVGLLHVQFRRRGITNYWVGTKASDINSNAFYEYLGFNYFGQVSLFGDVLNYYSRSLNSTASFPESLVLSRLLLISIVIFLLYFFSTAIGRHTAFLSGEFLFSFDYWGHVNELIRNHLLSTEKIFNLAQCPECYTFNQNSAWMKIWVLSFLGLGSILGIHPFVYYLFVIISSQLVGLYFFVRLTLKRFVKFPFLIASLAFIFFPQKIYLFPSGTLDGFIHALMLIGLGLFIYLLRHLSVFSSTQLTKYSLALGLVLSFFLHIGISHLPIILYLLLVIAVWHFRFLYRQFKAFPILVISVVLVVITINLPFVISEIRVGDTHYLTNFNPLTWKDAFTAGASLAGADPVFTFAFFFLVFFLLLSAHVSRQQKMLWVGLYIFTALLLTGGRMGSTYLYQFLFSYFPLFNHLRSLYRFIFLQDLILFLVIYFGLQHFRRWTKIILACLILIYLATYITHNTNLFHTASIPREYFDAASYLKSKPEKKVYFPAYWSSTSPTMTDNYNWLKLVKPARNTTLYTNPFTSLFSLPNIVHFENINLSQQQVELRALIDYSRDPEEIVKALEFAGIRYLIVDKNYLWNKNFPEVNLEKLTQEPVLDQQFGNIFIYRLNDRSGVCLPAYGDYLLGYCHNDENPKYLINKKLSDYILDNLNGYRLERNKKVRIPDFIVNVPTRLIVLEKKIATPQPIYQTDNNISSIYSINVSPGEYKLFVPVLKLSSESNIFRDSRLEIRLGETTLGRIAPYSNKEGMAWEEIEVSTSQPEVLTVSSEGLGFIVLSDPVLIPEDAWQKVLSEWTERFKDIRLISSSASR